jgi:hypothetical protein
MASDKRLSLMTTDVPLQPIVEIVEIGGERGLYYGGSIRHPMPFRADGDEGDQAASAFIDEIQARVDELEMGVSEHALDLEPLPDAPIEVLAYFDVVTGDHVAVWRIRCRERPLTMTAH